MRKITILIMMLFSGFLSQGQTASHLNFDGVNDRVDMALPTVFNNTTTSAFSVEVWVKPTTGVFSRIFFAQKDINNFFSITIGTTGNIYAYLNNTNVAITTALLSPSAWTHIAITKEATTNLISIYFNGVIQATTSSGTSTTGNDNTLALGCRSNGAQFYTGDMDDVRVWNRVLTQTEIANNMNCELPTPTTQAGLLAYYTFDQGIAASNNPTVTTLTDSSISLNNGTLSNFGLTAATSNWISGSPISNCQATHLNFDGVDDEINCGNSSSVQIVGNQISLEAMVNISSFASNAWQGNIINKEEDTPDYGYMLRVGSSGIVNFNIGNGSWNELNSPSNSISLNTWTHIAATYDGNNMKIYINGILVATSSNINITIGNTTSNLVIGNWSLGTGRNISGNIDEVRIWNRALSQTEIANNKSCELPNPTTQIGLAAYYKFNQGVNGANNAGITTATDSSVTAANGILTNMALTGATSNWISGSSIVTGIACSPFLGVNDYDIAVSSFKMYPNPAHGFIKIESEFDGDFQIINQLGQTIKTFTVSANVVNEVSLDNVSNGIYFIKGINGNKVASQKLIIN